MKRCLLTCFMTLCANALGIVGPYPATAQNDLQTPPPRIIRFASIYDVVPGIGVEDSRLAIEMIIRTTMQRQSDPFKVQLDFITEIEIAAERINNGGYHFLVLSGIDYFLLRPHYPMSPLVVVSKHEQPTEALFLVARRGESLETLGRKPESALIIGRGRVGANALIWLDTILWQAGLQDSQRHFSQIRNATKASRIVLPVFFGKADACIINASTFKLMADINPQIGKKLTIIERSEKLVALLLCATPLAKQQDIAALNSEARMAMSDEYTRAALTIIQMESVFPIKPEYLAATKTLLDRHQSLRAQRKTHTTKPVKALSE
ncbi:MAG: PhnD/SsuA/transferrin family substrate-binding protein [Desulfatitalea sp.]|nr:phosphate/phosphite/phosphonate ABC transporter substrate-binding protein [Desulfatitalea sp.]NNK00701.1 PhnD/SsuA/transferrin family substrate-binding protein [Desulfatitalea sp.]